MADTKTSDLAAITAAAFADVLQIVDDPGGTPASKQITVGDLLSLEFGQVYTAAGAGTQSPGATGAYPGDSHRKAELAANTARA